MSSRPALDCDAAGFGTNDGFDEALKKEIEDEVREAHRDVAEAMKTLPQGKLGAQPTGHLTFHQNRPAGHQIQRMGNTFNQFNITGGTIGQAAIGNTGPTTFNSEKKVFKEGSESSDIKISGGNFAQANLGGEADYNNKNAVLTAGTGSQAAGVNTEKLLLYIFEKGVTAEELAKLLEARYSLANIAFAMPKDEDRKRRMITALLMD